MRIIDISREHLRLKFLELFDLSKLLCDISFVLDMYLDFCLFVQRKLRTLRIYLRKIINGLQAIDGVTVYGDTDNISDKIGIVTFNIDDVPYTEVASALANTAGIDVGKGTFGAQPYVFRLLGIPNSDDVEEESADMPGMVRISMGIYNTEEEIDIRLDTVRNIAEK